MKPFRRTSPPVGTPQYDSWKYCEIAKEVQHVFGYKYPQHLDLIRDECMKRRLEWSTTEVTL